MTHSQVRDKKTWEAPMNRGGVLRGPGTGPNQYRRGFEYRHHHLLRHYLEAVSSSVEWGWLQILGPSDVCNPPGLAPLPRTV